MNSVRVLRVESRFCFLIQKAQFGTNKWRDKQGLGPRFSSGPLVDSPEFSFVDGRGFAPLNCSQRNRYLRDKYFTEKIVKHMKEFQIAKSLVPNGTVACVEDRNKELE
ncbi:hypothetical protein B4U80_03367 [Leptotrombidium deliense]|uniref:Uncharacterized protein n=1 Tax=Leptotrombidium deliense TaxID=299467 RepID=A0A443SL61_9ACAR|nr:hypothetical protein B4U80_03367 [Leptotrombidium deliense]